MKVVIAMDSFKGSLSSIRAGAAATDGIKRVFPDADCIVRPLADGGEGTVDALVEGLGGRLKTVSVTGPLGKKIESTYGITPDGTAIIEMSSAAGITLVPDHLRNPLNTTTYGVGELITDAIAENCKNFIIGIGGSATNDGGIGMLQALGFGILDKNGNQVALGAKGLRDIHSISAENALPSLKGCRFNIACDVTNPLCGENGCSAVFGPQKGADKAMIAQMDGWLSNFARHTKTVFPDADENAAGCGAAGGLGFAFMAYLSGELAKGIDLVLRETDLEEFVQDTDWVLTGEGRLDAQTAMGKAPSGVAKIAKKYSKPVLAFAGCVTPQAGVCNSFGIDAFFPILREVGTLEDALNEENAARNMADTVEQVFRLMKNTSQYCKTDKSIPNTIHNNKKPQ